MNKGIVHEELSKMWSEAHGRHGIDPSTHSFAQNHHVGDDIKILDSPQPSRSAPPGLHFIDDQLSTEGITSFPDLRVEILRRNTHAYSCRDSFVNHGGSIRVQF